MHESLRNAVDPDERWQFQPWYVKAARWLLYVPAGFIRGVLVIAHWFVTGANPGGMGRELSRWDTARLIWGANQSLVAYQLGQWSRTEEIVERIKADEVSRVKGWR